MTYFPSLLKTEKTAKYLKWMWVTFRDFTDTQLINDYYYCYFFSSLRDCFFLIWHQVDVKKKKKSKHDYRVLHAYLYWHTHSYICKFRVSCLHPVRLLSFSRYRQLHCSLFSWCLCIWCDGVSMAAQNNVYFSFYFCKCILTGFIFFCFKIVLFPLWTHACKLGICCFSVVCRTSCTFMRLVFKCINANQDFQRNSSLFSIQRYIKSCYTSLQILVISLT